MSEQNIFVSLRSFSDPIEAQIAQAMLQSEGIEAFVQNMHIATMQPLYIQAIGGVVLQVYAEDAPRARELLENIEETSASSEDGVPCPKCKSSNTVEARVRGAISILTLVLFGVPLLFPRRGYRCRSCGNRWPEKS